MHVEIDFPSEQLRRLADILPRGSNSEAMAKLIARAGARETLAQATGDAVPSTIGDVKAFRIFCLIEAGMTLEEAEAVVAAVFKVPSSTAKRLVNAAVARYLVDLRAQVDSTIAALLEDAVWVDKRWDVRIPSTFVRDRITDVLAEIDQPDPEPARRGSVWRFPDETYQAVRDRFGLPQRPSNG